MKTPNRREFLVGSSMVLGLTANVLAPDLFSLMRSAEASAASALNEEPGKDPSPRTAKPPYNTDLRTAIGLGDEPPSTVDNYGQLLWTRRAVYSRMQFGSPLQPAENAHWTQSLLDGYIPVVETHLSLGNSSLQLSAFASDHGDVKADYIEIKNPQTPYRVELFFPYTTSIMLNNGTVTSGDKVLAAFPRPKKSSIRLAKYNLLTPESWSTLHPAWNAYVPRKLQPDVDEAFATSRELYLNRPIEYRFPAQAGKTYHVVLGLFPCADSECPQINFPGWTLLKLSVDSESRCVDYALVPPGQPVLREFMVTPQQNELRVKSECDPSSTGWIRGCEISGIWIFDAPADTAEVITGNLNSQALYYVRCGRESIYDIACSVVLDYEPAPSAESCWIRLPYDTAINDSAALMRISPESARDAVKVRWESFVQKGAEFSTGVLHLDNLYKTSLINILLMRTKYEGRGKGGQDIYVVNPGPNLYNVFWTRDGSFMMGAFDLAGLPEEAEKSLRLLWDSKLTGTLAVYGQQASGAWASPAWQWDGQGQALMALLSHYDLTGDLEWLKKVYPNIRKGALWIKQMTNLTQIVNENGEKPLYYGLLPMASGEGAVVDPPNFIYHPNFWAVYGVREAKRAASIVGQTDDVDWMKDLDEQFSANLLASIRIAYQRIGESQFLPSTPFDAGTRGFGSIVGLYPSRFLDLHDPMVTATLKTVAEGMREDTIGGNYHTFLIAMCYLLADNVPMFQRLFNGYVALVSPTNAWVESAFALNRAGSGDMPHCWAAALYILTYRASLVYENERELEFCWGVQPQWLHDGARISVKRAPTAFGKVDFTLRRNGSELNFDYSLRSVVLQPAPEEIRLHIPNLEGKITSLRVNGRPYQITQGDSVVLPLNE